MNWIREIRKWGSFTFISMLLVCMPLAGCRGVTQGQNAAQAAEYYAQAQEAEKAGDSELAAELFEKAAEYQRLANESESADIINYVLGWIPGIPNSAKGAIAALGSAAAGSLFYERPRSNWKKAGGAMLDALRGLGNGGAMSGVGNALYSMKAVVGLEHTERANTEPEEEEPPGPV